MINNITETIVGALFKLALLLIGVPLIAAVAAIVVIAISTFLTLFATAVLVYLIYAILFKTN